MKIIKPFLFTLILLGAVNQTKAQAVFSQDYSGNPILEKRHVDVKGNPYWVEKWANGVVMLANGKTYKLDLKYDMITDELMFKTDKGDSLNFVQPVKEFRLSYIANDKNETHQFRSGFPSTGSKTNEKSFYEVIYDGNTKLLRRQSKNIWVETNTYATATQTKNISTTTNYFIYKQDKMIPVKADKKSIITALGDKNTELEKYIKDNKLNLKNDNDLVMLFTYYSTL